MKIEYPRWIPNPDSADGLPEILVKDEKQHIDTHPQDHAEKVAYEPPTKATVVELVHKERERCAALIESLPIDAPIDKGLAAEIVKAIREPQAEESNEGWQSTQPGSGLFD